jgi:hemerythrin superfamily protein
MSNESTNDVVGLLKAQHQRIRTMFDAVEQAHGADRQRRFAELRRFLAVHETAEEMVVHPRARLGEGGNDVVDARLKEEHSAKEVLSRLDEMKTSDADFTPTLAQLRSAVLEHAENEEREEFPILEAETDEKTRAVMADAVRAAEAIAPTHPHAGVESATANFVVGPVASVIDRTRDAVRSVLGRG